jgi:hypothetical protein
MSSVRNFQECHDEVNSVGRIGRLDSRSDARPGRSPPLDLHTDVYIRIVLKSVGLWHMKRVCAMAKR